jgi:hypothetical protein
MPSTTSARTRRNGRPLKSPLAVASSRICPGAPAAGVEETRPVPAIALSEREATINAYVSPARHLDGWMGKQGTGGVAPPYMTRSRQRTAEKASDDARYSTEMAFEQEVAAIEQADLRSPRRGARRHRRGWTPR